MVKGTKNAYLMYFSSLHSWFRCSVCYYLQCSSSLNQRVNQRVKKHFFVKICFNSCIIKKQKSNEHLRKKHKTPDRKISGGFLRLPLAWSLGKFSFSRNIFCNLFVFTAFFYLIRKHFIFS